MAFAPAPLYIATGNSGKLKEVHELALEYLGPRFTRVEGRAPADAEETGADFVANALIKSRALASELQAEGRREALWVIADDSGLAVDALGGEPGLRSARYAGDHVDPALHIRKLLTELARLDLPLEKRTARYHCALALVRVAPDGAREWTSEGTCEGLIAFAAEGQSGFGYDPVFYSPHFGKTLSQVSFAEKNSISHRRRAFESLRRAVDGG